MNELRRFGRFMVSGTVASATYVAMIWAGQRLGAAPAGAAAVGFVVATIASYLLHARLTFQQGMRGKSARRFLLVATAGAACSSAWTAWCQHEGVQQWLSTAVVLGATPVVTYTVHSLWTFVPGAHPMRGHDRMPSSR